MSLPGPPPIGPWADLVRSRAIERAEVDHGDVVLDLGSGDGRVLEALQPHIARGVGVEGDPARRAAAQARCPAVAFVDGDLCTPPLLEGLSTVLSIFSLRLLPPTAREALARTLAARLPAGGLWVIGDILFSVNPEQIDEIDGWFDPVHDHVVMVDPLEEMLKGCGFTVWTERLHPALAVVVARRRPSGAAGAGRAG